MSDLAFTDFLYGLAWFFLMVVVGCLIYLGLVIYRDIWEPRERRRRRTGKR